MNSHDTSIRTKSLSAAAKPLLALAVLLGTMALAASALAGPLLAPQITGVSTYSVCPGTVLTLTGTSGAEGFGGPGFQAQFQVGVSPVLIAPVYGTTFGPPTDTTKVVVPSSSWFDTKLGVTVNLWLSRSYLGGAGAPVQIRILGRLQCAISSSGGSAAVGPGVPINP